MIVLKYTWESDGDSVAVKCVCYIGSKSINSSHAVCWCTAQLSGHSRCSKGNFSAAFSLRCSWLFRATSMKCVCKNNEVPLMALCTVNCSQWLKVARYGACITNETIVFLILAPVSSSSPRCIIASQRVSSVCANSFLSSITVTLIDHCHRSQLTFSSQTFFFICTPLQTSKLMFMHTHNCASFCECISVSIYLFILC